MLIIMQKFYCFSQRLMRALVDNGFKPLYTEKSGKDGLRVVFEKTDALVEFVEQKYQSVRDNY